MWNETKLVQMMMIMLLEESVKKLFSTAPWQLLLCSLYFYCCAVTKQKIQLWTRKSFIGKRLRLESFVQNTKNNDGRSFRVCQVVFFSHFAFVPAADAPPTSNSYRQRNKFFSNRFTFTQEFSLRSALHLHRIHKNNSNILYPEAFHHENRTFFGVHQKLQKARRCSDNIHPFHTSFKLIVHCTSSEIMRW